MIVTQKNQRRIRPVNHSKNKRPIIMGAFLGLVLSLVLCFTQNIESMFYFSAAPYYIDSLVLESGGLVSIITFIYFIAIFSLLGYVFSLKLAKKFKLLAVIIIVILHCDLMQLGGETLFDGLPKAISNAFPSN
jgi:hypothetical protein